MQKYRNKTCKIKMDRCNESYAYEMLFLGSNFRGVHHFWGDPYLNSATILFDTI